MSRSATTDAAAIRELLRRTKEHGSCADCDENDPIVLDFDHLPKHEKKFTIAQAIALNVSLEKVKEDLEKCELVCSNCHRRRTAKRVLERKPFDKRTNRAIELKIGFREWCLKRRPSDTPEGDFLEDVGVCEKLAALKKDDRFRDYRMPDVKTLKELVDYLELRRACPEAILAAKSVWRQYILKMKALS